MQFSVIFEAQLANPTRPREQQVIRDCLEQAIFAEEMGFDRVWAVEHHSLYWYAHMSAPEIFLTAVAARTSRIRIGHGVVCMPCLLYTSLDQHGVDTRTIWTGNATRQPMLRGITVRSPASGLPVADQIMEFGFVLPSNHGMTDDDVDFVTGRVEDFLGGRSS